MSIFGDSIRYWRDGLVHRTMLRLAFPYSRIASTVLIQGDPRKISLGDGTYVGHRTYIVVSEEGDVSPVGFVGDSVRSGLIVGRQTFIGESNNIRAAGGIIKIGDHCLIAQNVSIIAANHAHGSENIAAWDHHKTGVVIEEGSWIAANVVILPGVTIGRGAIVAAGAVVTHSVGEGDIVGGVPASSLSRDIPGPLR